MGAHWICRSNSIGHQLDIVVIFEIDPGRILFDLAAVLNAPRGMSEKV